MRKLICLICLCLPATVYGEPLYPDISLDKLSTPEKQKAIGIEKLSMEEKEELRISIIERYLAAYKAGRKKGLEEAAQYFASQLQTSGVIENQIDGDFEG